MQRVRVSDRATNPDVVPAKAGTHNHRKKFVEVWSRRALGAVPQPALSGESRGMGPGLRRDDSECLA